MKKTLSLFLAVVLTVGIFCSVPFSESPFIITAQAASSGTCGDNLKWILDADGTLTISGKGKMEDYNWEYFWYIPWGSSLKKIKNIDIKKGVTSIGKDAFHGCENLTTIKIPNGMKSIGESAFWNCENLDNIIIPDSVTSIGRSAFYNTKYSNNSMNWDNDVLYIGKHLVDTKSYLSGSYSIKASTVSIADNAFENCEKLVSIIIPDGLINIGKNAFLDCYNLVSITLPDSVKSIGDRAFSYCERLASVTIPAGTKNIGAGVFFACDGLVEINVSENNTNYSAVDGVLYDKGKNELLCYPSGKANASYVIPDSVTIISESAFNCSNNLDEIVFPNNLKSIGDNAFYGCENLKEVNLPDSLTKLGSSSFAWCNSITKVSIGGSLTCISHRAFEWCSSLRTIIIPDSVKSISESAFAYCESLKRIVVPDSVISIGSVAFSNCSNLTVITIPDSVVSIGWGAFSNTGYCDNLDNWNNGVLYINNHLIDTDEEVSGEYSVRQGTITIAEGAFDGCKDMISVNIPDSVVSICYGAFDRCENLESIKIPDSVINISHNAFDSTKFYNNPQNWDCGVLYIDNHLVEANYDISENYVIKEGTVSIAEMAFDYNTKLVSVTIPDSMVSIGYESLGNCENLQYVFYLGNKSDWDKISIGENNGSLINAKIHYELKGHTEGEWEIHKEATVNAVGSKHKKCTVCGAILKTAEIPQLKCSKPSLKKIENAADGVKITWGKVTGADSYEVYRKVKGGSYSKVGTTSKTYFTDKTAKSGKQYYYVVKAVNEAGKSSNSNALSIKYLADPTLKTPTSAKKGITLKWTKTTGAQGYIVYRKTGNGSYSKLTTVKGVSNLSYVDKSAKKNNKYTYKVKAYYGKTYSAYSNAKTIKDKY